MSLISFYLLILQILSYHLIKSDFVYADFNETTGLIFVGSTGTSDCLYPFNNETNLNSYANNVHGAADRKRETSGGNADAERGEKTDSIFESTMDTNAAADNYDTETFLAGFLHRSDSISAPEDGICPVRVRLTPSGPSKVGGMWFRDEVPVLNGFETTFEFQISDHSKECTLHKDQYFSLKSHLTCSVRGADGFAFVIQRDDNGTSALGSVGGQTSAQPGAASGGQMGFGGTKEMPGIRNSLAIAFDTWQNQGYDEVGVDHVKIQSRGQDSNDALTRGLLGFPRVAPLADGKRHRCKIVYFTEVIFKYLDALVASDTLSPYLKDNGEQKRVGTLVIFMDDGIENDKPLMAMPINLSLLLNLPGDKAYVGFTASTGRFYEKHDILAWHFCDQNPCDQGKLEEFDYHQKSKSYDSRLRMTPQGSGFGGDQNANAFPLKHTSPDITAIEMPQEHFATGHFKGLSSDGSKQIPDATLS